MTDLTELRRLLEEGTQGPWERVSAGEISGGERLWDDVISPGPVSCMSYCYGGSSAVEMTDADADLIAAAVNALPDLLDQIETLREALAAYCFCPSAGDPYGCYCPVDHSECPGEHRAIDGEPQP